MRSSARAAIAGAFLFAFSPSDIVYCTQVLTETLYLFWIALAVLLALRLYRSSHFLAAIG